MKLKPLADRVVLKQKEAEEKTKSGIIPRLHRAGEARRSTRSSKSAPAAWLTATRSS